MVTSKKTPARKVAKRAARTRSQKTAPVPEAGQPVASPEATDATPKQKLVRDSFTMPKREYEQIGVLKARLLKHEHVIKKGELLRAGIAALTALSDTRLLAVAKQVQRLKTGRPEKTKPVAGTSTKKKG